MSINPLEPAGCSTNPSDADELDIFWKDTDDTPPQYNDQWLWCEDYETNCPKDVPVCGHDHSRGPSSGPMQYCDNWFRQNSIHGNHADKSEDPIQTGNENQPNQAAAAAAAGVENGIIAKEPAVIGMGEITVSTLTTESQNKTEEQSAVAGSIKNAAMTNETDQTRKPAYLAIKPIWKLMRSNAPGPAERDSLPLAPKQTKLSTEPTATVEHSVGTLNAISTENNYTVQKKKGTKRSHTKLSKNSRIALEELKKMNRTELIDFVNNGDSTLRPIAHDLLLQSEHNQTQKEATLQSNQCNEKKPKYREITLASPGASKNPTAEPNDYGRITDYFKEHILPLLPDAMRTEFSAVQSLIESVTFMFKVCAGSTEDELISGAEKSRILEDLVNRKCDSAMFFLGMGCTNQQIRKILLAKAETRNTEAANEITLATTAATAAAAEQTQQIQSNENADTSNKLVVITNQSEREQQQQTKFGAAENCQENEGGALVPTATATAGAVKMNYLYTGDAAESSQIKSINMSDYRATLKSALNYNSQQLDLICCNNTALSTLSSELTLLQYKQTMDKEYMSFLQARIQRAERELAAFERTSMRREDAMKLLVASFINIASKPNKTDSNKCVKNNNHNNNRPEPEPEPEPKQQPESEPKPLPGRNSFDHLKSEVSHVCSYQDHIIVGTKIGELYDFSTSTHDLRAKTQAHTKAITGLHFCVRNQTIYSISLDGVLKRTPVSDLQNTNNFTQIDEGLHLIDLAWEVTFVSTRSNRIFTVDALNKPSLLCTISHKWIVSVKATENNGNKFLLVGCKNHAVLQYNAVDGTLLHTFRLPRHACIFSMLINNDHVYCGTQKDIVYKINFMTGQINEISSGNGIVVMALYKNDYILCGCNDGGLYVLHKHNHMLLGSMKYLDSAILAIDVIVDKIIISSKSSFKIIQLPLHITKKL